MQFLEALVPPLLTVVFFIGFALGYYSRRGLIFDINIMHKLEPSIIELCSTVNSEEEEDDDDDDDDYVDENSSSSEDVNYITGAGNVLSDNDDDCNENSSRYDYKDDDNVKDHENDGDEKDDEDDEDRRRQEKEARKVYFAFVQNL